MEWLKKYWMYVLLAPVVIYFLWKYYEAKNETAKKMQAVRDAKADKAVINKAIEALEEQQPEPKTDA